MLLRGRGADVGPVQVLLIDIDGRDCDRMLAAELQDLRNQDAVTLLDVLRVRRGYDDEIRRLDPVEGEDRPGALVEALLVVDQDEPESPEERRLRSGRGGEDVWFLADRLPRGAAAAILLIEHRWAVPLREASVEFEAEIFGDAWVHPRDLAAARDALGHGRR